MLQQIKIIFADIKIQHTVFALPFAVMSAFLAADGVPNPETMFWIVVAMFGARSAGMAFNRLADAEFDARNPRTADRALPAGKISKRFYGLFLAASSLLLVFASARLNTLALALSPVALALVFFYSLTKRFTAYSHVFLGLALASAPVGAWVAVRAEISLLALVLGAAVVFWLVGFDIIYACLDMEFDREHRLFSIPQRFGVERALKFAYASHAVMIIFLILLSAIAPKLGGAYLFGVGLVAGLLAFEHSLVKSDDLSKVNFAFFNVNGVISLALMLFVIVDCLWV